MSIKVSDSGRGCARSGIKERLQAEGVRVQASKCGSRVCFSACGCVLPKLRAPERVADSTHVRWHAYPCCE
eukprot:4638747-Pleurochrysis_carterae.AAC.1